MSGRRKRCIGLFVTGLALAGVCSIPRGASAGPRVRLDRVVAVVNDDVILYSELERTTNGHPLLHEALSQLPSNASPQMREQKRRDVEARVLDELIDFTLMKAEAAKFSITVDEEDLRRGLENVARSNGLTVAELRTQVEASDEYGSWEEYRDELRDQILLYKVPHYLATWSVSEAQVREHYRKMTRDESAKVKVEQFVFTPKSQGSTDRDQAFARAQAVARRLRDGEAPDRIAAELGDTFERVRTIGRGDVAPAMEDAIFAAKKNQVVGPLASGQGYVVYKVVEKIESAALSYEQAKDRIRQQLEEEAYFKAEQELRRQLRAKAHVDIRL